ncbi:muscle, skeletal receptor tyrosine protein kinase-like isoform X3 [Physella acuta]|uniref:muscle, skeletal receptor tyrosine protein kinase-like isoform X3 n=1 Tax=Physella acuta TaxID=109671 RepID=UPI0027DC087A|nr:muscle, skeletal receptor tyrosine protein kinase-like isoform X3 [Physella acuta]
MISHRWVFEVVTLTLLCLMTTLEVQGSLGDQMINCTSCHLVEYVEHSPPRNKSAGYQGLAILRDTRLRLYCPLASRGKVRWYHNNILLNDNNKDFFFEINKSLGTLTFKKIHIINRGKYQCKVVDEYQRILESEITPIRVEAPVSLASQQPTENITVFTGTEKWFSCTVAAIPEPTIIWYKNNIPMSNHSSVLEETDEDKVGWTSRLLDVVTESAVYTCKATNRLTSTHSVYTVSADFHVTAVSAVEPQADDPGVTQSALTQQHMCSAYNGTVCRQYLHGRYVYHNSSMDPEQFLQQTFSEMAQHVPSGSLCQVPATRMLCHLIFPDCKNDTNEPLPLCNESCFAVQTLFCFQELAQLSTTEGSTKGLSHLPQCSGLPSKWDTTLTCIESNHHDYSPSHVRDDCYVEKGRWYNGTMNVTKSGIPCQPWAASYPQSHTRSPKIFPELLNSENFCRNPGGEEERPWCYTTDKLVRWEYCDLQVCPSTQRPEASLEEFDELLMTILVPIVLSVTVLSTLVIGLLLRWRHTHYNAAPQDDLDIENLPINSAYHQMKTHRLNPKLETLEFPRNDIVFIEDIGQGAFGRVFKARIMCSNGNSHITGGKLSASKHNLACGCKHNRNPFSSRGDLRHLEMHFSKQADIKLLGDDTICEEKHSQGQLIAIKMLKEDASETVQADFEREASLMVEFDHPNIVRLLGVCTIGKPMCLLFEYMSKGDLNEFLRLCSPDQCLRRSDAGSVPSIDEVSSIDMADQLHMARQIANGMIYLSDRGYVHRDLATRNCLVGRGLTVKISDFGLARSIHSMDYYHGSDKDAIPIRWMPPEAILFNKFSSQSDVWSFGVLLWEIFSFALQPYYGMTHEEVINYLRAGKVLAPTENETTVVYELMKSCWHKKPSSRPSFTFLYRSLTLLYEDTCKQKGRKVLSL